MKRLKYISASIFVIVFCIGSITSCKKEAVEPRIDFTASALQANVGDTITFTVHGPADGFSIYTGDAGHQFEFSRYVLTKGQDIEKEIVYLTAADFDSLSNSGLVTSDSILTLIRGMIGVRYEGRSHPEELIKEFYNYEISWSTLLYPIVDHFTVEQFRGMPSGGYSTGVALDPEMNPRIFRYAFDNPGTYTVNLLATNVGRKIFDGNGYNPDRVTTESEYDRKTVVKQVTIKVN